MLRSDYSKQAIKNISWENWFQILSALGNNSGKNPAVGMWPFAVGYCRVLSFFEIANSFYEPEYYFEVKSYDSDMSTLKVFSDA